MFSGSMVALVTPFKQGKIDRDTLAELVEFQLAGGTHAIVPCGTTGESATLSFQEHGDVIRTVIEVVDGRVPVLAGTGSNSTEEAIALTKAAKELGAAGALLITPYYNKPSQEGLFQHFKAIAEAVDLPQVLYNVPGRTSVNMLPETVKRLAGFDTIIGIKEASGDLVQMSEVIALCGDQIRLFSGDDALVVPVMAIGGSGVISVAANVVPNEMAKLVMEMQAQEYESARKRQVKLLDLCQAMFYETNPVPVKTALHLMGKIGLEFRLPLCKMQAANRERLETVLKAYDLIS